jgi:hypothetical protein
MIMAMAIAASAAAMVMINKEKNKPSNLAGNKYLLNATKLIFTLFNMSSMDMSMVIKFLLVNNPYMPMKNKAVLTKRIWVKGTSFMVLILLFV